MRENFLSENQGVPEIVSHKNIDLSKYKESITGTDLEQAFEKVIEICNAIKVNNGTALLVGGCVRDLYLGRGSKDYDIEIYGLDYGEIKSVLGEDYEISEVGKAFGIIKVHTNAIDIDISLPRIDSKVGEGHTGFVAHTDKHMSIDEAARRRDFTFNTLAMDPMTGEVYDHFGGISDIEHRMLRVTDETLFSDDPLRVLRAMQFVGRFGLTIAEESKAVLKETATHVYEVSQDRFFEEFKKLLIKSEKPSLGLMAAAELGIFEHFFPHFLIMQATPQEPEWHPEGDVWTHTLMVVDEAALLIKSQSLSEDQKMVIMLSALLHDVGKPETTHISDGNRIVSPGHEQAGEIKAREFLKHINAPKEITEKVVRLVTQHMMPGSLYRAQEKGDSVTDSAIRRLAKKLHPATIEELIMVSNADSYGRGGIIDKTAYKPGEWLKDQAGRIGVTKEPPNELLRGKDLIELGFKPDKLFGNIITMADRIRSLREALESIDPTTTTENTKDDLLALIADLEHTSQAVRTLREEALATISRIREMREK